jgi:N-acetylglucosamine-6-sulfatase
MLLLACAITAAAVNPPNVIFFLTDDQDQVLGGSFPRAAPNGATPLRKTSKFMEADGATADAFYIHTPICCPSRAETMTGRYLQNVQLPFAPKAQAQCTGGYGGKSTDGDVCCMHIDEGRVNNQTFALNLKNQGYTVGFFGKTLNNCPELPFNGVNAWLANGGGEYNNPEFAIYGIEGLSNGMLKFNENNTQSMHLLGSMYSTSVIGNYSLNWVKKVAKGSKPWMAYVGFKAAHDPFDPAPWYKNVWKDEWPDAAPRPRSWNMTVAQLANHHPTVANQSPLTAAVAECIDSTFKDRWRTLMSVDDSIGEFYEAIEEAGALSNTYFMFSSDHGYVLCTSVCESSTRVVELLLCR